MLVRELTHEGYRNLHPDSWRPCAGVNILYGDNAQGKTNLLEACWLFTGSRSFRGAKDSETVRFGADEARLKLDFTAGGREQSAEMLIRQRRQVSLNGVKLASGAKMAGVFCGVVFSPAHLSLIKDGPEARRRFADSAYCQLRPGYIASLAEYNKVLTQRNACLRQLADGGAGGAADPDGMLTLWDHTLAAAGARLTAARRRYIEKLQPVAAEIYAGLSGGREKLTLQWHSAACDGIDGEISPAGIAERWFVLMRESRRADMAAGFSTVGAHREDLTLSLDGVSVRAFGSQGQQRSAVLSLKLAEAALLEEVTGETPVAFLDDVMSELDVSRQDYILNHIRDWQVFITCCEPSHALRMTAGEVFRVSGGTVARMEQE